jgi:thiosulfate/3-mercaptopyruvate sulfurtransferase
MRFLLLSLLVFTAWACNEAPQAVDPGQPTPPLVDADWLRAHRDEVVLVDMQSTKELYEKGHIPGAIHITVNELRDDNKLLAPVEVLEKKLGALGIRGDTWVVAYDEKEGRNATWMWYALMQMGHRRISLLDGNMSAFKEELETGSAKPEPTTYVAYAKDPKEVVDTDWVIANKDEVLLLDTRPLAQYTGSKPKQGYRAGHMPGAIHFHRGQFLKPDGTFVDVAAGRELAGKLPRDRKIVVFCNTFHDGAHVAFQLHRLGFDNLLYWDSGYKDYMSDESRPLKLGDQP